MTKYKGKKMTKSVHYFIDRFVEDKNAQISVHDLGFSRNLGVFDVMRTYNKKPFHLNDHIERFFFSLTTVKLSIPYTKEDVSIIVKELIELNSFDHVTLKLIATGGTSIDGFTKPKIGNFYVIVYPIEKFHELSTNRLYAGNYIRSFPYIKSLNYLPAFLNLEQAKEKGFDDALYMDKDKKLLEASRSNLFLVRGNQLITPKKNVLTGITKEIVKRIGQTFLELKEEDIYYNDLCESDELFITSTVKEIVSVIQIDDMHFPKNEITKQLFYKLQDYVENKSWQPLNIDWKQQQSFFVETTH